MGYGVPSGIAAKVVHPDRVVVSFSGDGCFLMNGQELATAAQYGCRSLFVVINNGMYGTIRMHQEREYPARVYATALDNPDFRRAGTRLRIAWGDGAREPRTSHRRSNEPWPRENRRCWNCESIRRLSPRAPALPRFASRRSKPAADSSFEACAGIPERARDYGIAVLVVLGASEADRLTVAPRLRRGDIAIAEAVNQLRRAEFRAPCGCAHNAMTALRETTRYASSAIACSSSRLPSRAIFQRGASAAVCGFCPIVDQAYHHLHMALRLHVGAHHAEAHDRLCRRASRTPE